jgi:tripartite-type tricarboxylate transporter receptor subunit TctC
VLGGHRRLVSSASVILYVIPARCAFLYRHRSACRTLAAIPTLKEQGIDAVVDNCHHGGARFAAQQTAYWDGIMRQMTQSPEWRKIQGQFVGEHFPEQ